MMGLCVIDMQPYYEVSQVEWLIDNVLCEIKKAKRQHLPILLVKTIGAGEIDDRIFEEVESYSDSYVVTKKTCDGHQEIIKVLKRNKLGLERLRVCGVETDACVADTVTGLAESLPGLSIEVVKKACNHYNTRRCPKTARQAIAWASALPNVKSV
jgi:nicotinamidase-related amidase